MSSISGTVQYPSSSPAPISRLSSAERSGAGGAFAPKSQTAPALADPANIIQGLLQSSLSAATAVHLASLPSEAQPASAQAPQSDASKSNTPQGQPDSPESEGDAPISAKAAPQAAAPVEESAEESTELSEEEQKIVDDLKATDQEVKAHEQAHATVGGPYAGQPQYEYTTGPDGKRYAIGGEVAIDVSPIANNPDATIRKMDIVIRAALAPAEPSAQDKQVAQSARQIRLQAQIEKRELQEQSLEEGGPSVFTAAPIAESQTASAVESLLEDQSNAEADSPKNTLGNEAALAALSYATSQALSGSLSGISGVLSDNRVNIVA